MSEWSRIADKLKQLAYIDEADNWEVDQAGIYLDEATGEFVLLTATGCSCWDGNCDEERFATFDELEYALLEKPRDYNPTLKGATELLEEARRVLKMPE